jgi:hypothetical protein
MTSSASQQPAGPLTARQEGFRRFPVVTIVFDELPVASLMNRRGGIDAKLFPNFARLARGSTWFRNATTIKGFSKQALPALLTGRYPAGQDTFGPGQPPRSLFTLIGGSHEIRTDDRLPVLCPQKLCEAFVGGTDDVGSHGSLGAFAVGERGARLWDFLDLIEAGREPRFYFVHLMLPHGPWRFLPSGQRYPEEEPMPGESDPPGRGKGWRRDPWLVAQGLQRHLLQTQLADRALGMLIDKLEATGLYGRSLLVVTADHGQGFVPGRLKRVLSKETLGHIAAVPLFIRRPLQERAHISDDPVETVDVVPTIADVLNLSTVWLDMDGRSLFDAPIPPDRERVIEKLPLDPAGREKYDLVAQKYSTFAPGRRGLDLFKLAPGAREHLIGRPLGGLLTLRGGRLSVDLPQVAALQGADPAACVFPALVEGTVEGASDDEKVVLVIAVNGRIAAVTRTFRQAEETRFSSMLSPESFSAAPNTVEVFEVVGARPEILVPVPAEPTS